jgi:endonuclease-8
MRVHFMLFGTFEAVVNGKAVTGDYKRAFTPRLSLTFPNGTIVMFNCSIKYLEEKNAKKSYDFSVDIMSPKWNPKQAYENVRKQKGEDITDALLDQTLFAGVGNIIKNEVLSMAKVNPKTKVGTLSPKKIRELVAVTRSYSEQFYKWRKKFVLRKHYTIYHKAACPHCGGKVTREKTGTRKRWSYYCPLCQKY